MRRFILFLFLFSVFSVRAQLENRYWIMGYENYVGHGFGGFSIDFYNNQPDTFSVDRAVDISTGTSNISSRDGRFLFVVNGEKIGDASNSVMMNGDSLICLDYCSDDGNNVSQSNIILPDPADTSKYYVFYSTGELNINTPIGAGGFPIYLYYATVDMNLNGGLGEVTGKNIVLRNDTIALGTLSACKHANGRDWWLIFQDFGREAYIKYLITPYGINFSGKQSIGVGGYLSGSSIFSPDGSYYLTFDYLTGLQVFDFDRCSGDFSNARFVPYTDTINFGYGAAFSSSSRYIYIDNPYAIYQYDLFAPNLILSRRLIGIWDGYYDQYPLGTQFHYMALARDGKIYVVTGNGTHYIHRIEYPDSSGISCNFQQRNLKTPRWYWRAIPNHPNYQLEKVSGSICDSVIAITELAKAIRLEVYPNPIQSRSIMYIQFNKVGKDCASVELIDVNGSVNYLGHTLPYTSVFSFLVPVLSPGIYFLRFVFKDDILSKKIIIE